MALLSDVSRERDVGEMLSLPCSLSFKKTTANLNKQLNHFKMKEACQRAERGEDIDRYDVM